MDEGLKTIETWFERVWANEEENAIQEMLIPDTKAMGLGTAPKVGPNEFVAFHRSFLKMMSDVRVVVERYMRDGDWYSTMVTLHAKRRDTGQAVSTTGHILFRISGNTIPQAYNHFDFMGLFEQLDLLPPNTMDRCFSGEKLAC